jgi:hypothetical protein
MAPAAEPPPDGFPDPQTRERHELLTRPTIVSVRAGMIRLAVRRSPSLAERERDLLLAETAAIQDAVRAIAADADRNGGDARGAGCGTR